MKENLERVAIVLVEIQIELVRPLAVLAGLRSDEELMEMMLSKMKARPDERGLPQPWTHEMMLRIVGSEVVDERDQLTIRHAMIDHVERSLGRLRAARMRKVS